MTVRNRRMIGLADPAGAGRIGTEGSKHLKQPCFTALMGGGEQAQQLTSNLVVRRARIDRLNRLP